jgi:hypothetical protein
LIIALVIVVAVLGGLTLAGAVTEVTGHGKRKGVHVLAYRWHRGDCLDGKERTDATWTQPASRVLHPKGRAHKWHWVRGRRRSAVRVAAEALVLLTGAGLLVARTLTVALLAILAAPLSAWAILKAVHRARTWRHRRHYVHPLRRTLATRLRKAPAAIEVQRDGTTVKAVAISWAPETEITAEDKQLVLSAVTTRLAIEAPDVSWSLRGRERAVRLTQSEPPPSLCGWDDIAAAVEKAGQGSLVFGPGKKSEMVDASFSKDSPHVAISGGSGGGKSNLAAVLALQELHRGSIVFNLDPKWISHLWLQDLPNVINAHDIPHLHLALTWLGRELLRRTKAAYYSAGGTGRVRANVGPRLLVQCEELNYAMADLKDHWREIRTKEDPKRSPALKALAALACAGRASDIHLVLMAQMLTAQSTGVSDSSVRGNAGIKVMARYDANNWNMVVGKHIPMPAEPTAPGRVQLVTGQRVREVQIPYLRLDDEGAEGEEAVRWARSYAVSGQVALLPTGPEGIPPALIPACVVGQPHFASLGAVTAGQEPETPSPGTGLPPHPVTLREACDAGLLHMKLGAARKAAQRPGFPQPMGWDGPAALYDPSELKAFTEGKVRVLR